MHKLVILLTLLFLALGVVSVAAQDATPTPTPLPPLEVTASMPEFTGESDNFAGIDPSGVTITYWHQYNNPTQLSYISGIVNAFNAANPYGIRVDAKASGNYNDIRTSTNNAIISGDLPNLVAGFPNDSLSYALDDVVVDLTPYYADAKWGFDAAALADLNQVALDSWLFENGRLGVPNQLSGEVMFSNAAMMQELGFSADSPVTLDEFAAAACAAANSNMTGADGATVQGYPIVADASQFETTVAGIGGNIWVDGQWNFTTEESTRVLQLFKDLYDQGCAYIPEAAFGNTADWARAINPFAFSSSAGIAPTLNTVRDAGNLVTDWKVLPAPVNAAGDKPVIQLFTPGIMIMSATPEEQLASWLFLRFFASPEIQAQWSQSLSLFPLSKSASAMLDSSKMVPQFLEIVNKVANDEVGVYVSHQNLSYGQVRSILATGIADVTSGGLDVAEVAQRMTDEANAAMASG
ncbi:MAG: extracellular solute-binding protein [Anaerolineae bacterium]